MMTLQQAQRWLPQAQIVGSDAVRFDRVHTDTRTLKAAICSWP